MVLRPSLLFFPAINEVAIITTVTILPQLRRPQFRRKVRKEGWAFWHDATLNGTYSYPYIAYPVSICLHVNKAYYGSTQNRPFSQS